MRELTPSERARCLAALYNRSVPLGMGMLAANPSPMTEAEAAELLRHQSRFDYLRGRVMKINIPSSLEEFDFYLYDRDIGQGAGEAAVLEALTAPSAA